MHEAEILSELLDTLLALMGLLGTWSDAVRYKTEVLDLAENIGKVGSKASVVIANGVKSTIALLAKLEAIVAAVTTLEIAMPLADKIMSELAVVGLATYAKPLKEAAELLVNYREHLPTGCLDAFSTGVVSAASAYYELVKAIASGGECDPTVDITDVLTVHSETLSELSLAFPMDAWHVDQRAVLNEMTVACAASAFEAKLRDALTPLIVAWEGVEVPSDKDVSAVESILAEAAPEMHFLGRRRKRSSSALSMRRGRCSWPRACCRAGVSSTSRRRSCTTPRGTT